MTGTLTRVQLRPARVTDAGSVADVYLASRRALVAFAPLAHSDAEVRDWVAGVLIASGGVTVAQRGDEIVGMLAVSASGAFSWIDQLYVHPAHVATGVGSRLLVRALEALPRPIRLYTFAQNGRARRFYEARGFVAVAFGDGSGNEEGCPDVLYELASV